jgi:hypothetical protein
MKRFLVVFSAVLLLAALIPQPAAAKVDVNFGIKGGISLAQAKWTEETIASGRLLQPVYGVFAAFNLSKSIAIQPEAYLLTQGGKWSMVIDSDTFTEKDFYRYIHIPVLAKVRLIKEGKFTPILFAGPAVDFLLSAHVKYYTNGTLDKNIDIKQYYKSTAFGLVFGAGVEHNLSKVRLILDIRYDMGLTDIETEDATETLKTRTLMFMLGVGF